MDLAMKGIPQERYRISYNYYIIHHHHVALAARMSMTISRQPSLLYIVPGRSSAEQPASSHSWSM